MSEVRLGPYWQCVCGGVNGDHRPECEHSAESVAKKIIEAANEKRKESDMHYRNGREAKNGDLIVRLQDGKVEAFGVLHSAVPGDNYCNGKIAVVQPADAYACMVDCLHVDDLAEILKEKGLDKRPEGK